MCVFMHVYVCMYVCMCGMFRICKLEKGVKCPALSYHSLSCSPKTVSLPELGAKLSTSST